MRYVCSKTHTWGMYVVNTWGMYVVNTWGMVWGM